MAEVQPSPPTGPIPSASQRGVPNADPKLSSVTGAIPSPVPRPRQAKLGSLRGDVPTWQAVLLGIACIALCGAIWWALTAGEVPEDRVLPPAVLPSPVETFGDFGSLWFDHALTRNTFVSLRRVVLGFGLAAVVGIPLGVLCGCFRRIGAFFSPLMIVGRNIPVAAVIPLTLSLFGIGEFQKVMFIFVACVAFIVMDTATAIMDVSSRYVDTAYTLGAKRRQIVLKVLVPLAMPSIFNSLRLLFGLAFGYIMLAEVIQIENIGGLGSIINFSQSRGGHRTYILLVLMLIPLVALGIDRLLFWVQRQLFPYQYGGNGWLHHGLRAILRGWESVKLLVFKPVDIPTTIKPEAAAAPATPTTRPEP